MNMRTLGQRDARLLLLLILTDLLFIAIHLIARAFPSLVSSREALLVCERGYAELYQYVKWLWLVLLMLLYFAQHRHTVYLFWAGAFAYLLLDDSMRIHETAGLWLREHLSLPSPGGMRGRDLGEILVSLGVGSIMMAVALPMAGFSTRYERIVTLIFIGMLGGLALCGILADALHMMVKPSHGALVLVLEIIEDGGELIVASVGLSTAYSLEAIVHYVNALLTHDITRFAGHIDIASAPPRREEPYGDLPAGLRPFP